jgi:acetyl esterase/lipase
MEMIRLWPGAAPSEAPLAAAESITNDTFGFQRIWNVGTPELAVFPKRSHGAFKVPALLVLPGGGFQKLAWEREGVEIARRFAHAFDCFVLKYRVPLRPALPRLPSAWAQIQDAERAVELLRARRRGGVVGVLGFSAGAHLAAHLCSAAAQARFHADGDRPAATPRPDFAILMYPWNLLAPHYDRFAGGNQTRSRLAVGLRVGPDHPPTMLVHAEDDVVASVDNSIVYHDELHRAARAAGSPSHRRPVADLHVYGVGGHSFALCMPGPRQPPDETAAAVCSWPRLALEFVSGLGLVNRTRESIR